MQSFKKHYFLTLLMVLTAGIYLQLLNGCGGTAMEAHKKGLEGITEDEYVVPKKPVDQHYIGAAWSKQFGPIEDPSSADILVKKERSLNKVQQDFAFNRGFALGGQLIAGPTGEVGIHGSGIEKAKLEGLEIITPVSLADVPFEPNIPYITEALRLANFRIKEEKAAKAGIGVTAGTAIGTGTAVAEIGSEGRRGTEGEGLVVAYKLHMIDPKTYTKQESGRLPLELEKAIDFAKANVIAKTRLQIIEPGAGKSLPRNVIWSCPQADAKSRDMVAAWIVELKPTDPKRKSLTIAFPAFPKIEDCYNYSGVIYSRIDPLTDKIIRQKINIMIIDADVSDSMKPEKFDARISLIDEAFNIRLTKPGELEETRQ